MVFSLDNAFAIIDWQYLFASMTSAWPVWLLGVFVGLLLPRSSVLLDGTTFVASSLAGVGVGAWSSLLSHAMMAFHGAMFIQSLWFKWTAPGTLHRLLGLSTGRGSAKDRSEEEPMPGAGKDDSWYITESDLQYFIHNVEMDKAPNADSWAHGADHVVTGKVIPGQLTYVAKRRTLRDLRKTEYMSVSVTADTTPQEVMDFYLSDPDRQRWDNMLTVAETIESGRFSEREQVVHWVRTFPFAFLSDRSYVIARRVFAVDDVLYGISKVVKHPQDDPGRTVRMDTYWSMWSCRQVQCPFGTENPATETTLLHMEDFKIAEHLSRFAVKCGMWGFIKQMAPHLRRFVTERRARGIAPTEKDPLAFGAPQEGGGDAPGTAAPTTRENIPASGLQRWRKLAVKGLSAGVALGMLLALGGGQPVHGKRR